MRALWGGTYRSQMVNQLREEVVLFVVVCLHNCEIKPG